MLDLQAKPNVDTGPGIDKPISGRILFVSSTPHHGGIERVGVRLAADLPAMTGNRFPVDFACRPGSFSMESCQRDGVRVWPYSPRNSGDLASIWRLAQVIAKCRPAVVHVHSRRDYLPATLAVGAARAMGHDSRLFFHCHMVRSLGEPIRASGKFFARRVDRFLAVSESVRADLLARHPDLPSDRVVVVPNGVDTGHVASAAAAREAVRGRLGIDHEDIVIGMVGRLDAKGQIRLVEQIPALMKALSGRARALFVGSEGPEGYEKQFLAMANEIGARDGMILTGSQEDVAPYLAAMDIFAHLPKDEAFGLAIAEAMAARLPVVASLAPGCSEIVRDGENGYLVGTDDPDALRKAILALALSPALRAEMGAAGETRVRGRYSTQRQIANLAALYEAVIKA